MKYVKRRLVAGADHFNRKPKKGLEFLKGERVHFNDLPSGS